MALWEELLQPATLGGVELPIGRRRITGGRDNVRKALPYTGGQETEPMGRRARRLEVEVELFADVDEALYPERYEQLVAVLQDDDEPHVQWNDPVWGPIQVSIAEWDVIEEGRARDGAVVTIVLEEEGIGGSSDDATFSLLTTSDRSRAETDADELDLVIVEAGITQAELEAAWRKSGFARQLGETLSYARTVARLIKDLDDAAQDSDEVAAKVDRVRARIEAAVRLGQARSSVGWPVLERGMRLIDTIARIGDAVIARQGRIVIRTTTGPTSVYELAAKLYGDPARVDEILRRNPLPRPLFIPAGTVLRLLER